MLRQILDQVRSADRPMTLKELSRVLGVEPSALEGMVDYLVQKGKLRDDDERLAAVALECDVGSCGAACPGRRDCPFVARMPRTFSFVPEDSSESIVR